MADAVDDPLSRPLSLAGEPSWSWSRTLVVLTALLFLSPAILLLHALLLPPLFLLFASYSIVFHPALLRGLPRDALFIFRLVRATRQLKQRLTSSRGTFTAADYFAETVKRYGARDALIFEGSRWTYAEVDAESDRVARWALGEGLQAGDGVALICANRPEHLFLWLGFCKAGITTTLINGALRGASLEHALGQCDAKRVIFDGLSAGALAPLAATVSEARSRFVCLEPSRPSTQGSTDQGSTDQGSTAQGSTDQGSGSSAAWAFARALELPEALPQPDATAFAALLKTRREGACRSSDTLLHIFTSGTTGLPKAARLNHIRFFSAIVIPHMFSLKRSDRVYCCLPMCHTAAIGSISICWWLGAPLILARRFSVRSFWQDCAEHRATVVQYVGELCRYLVHAPPSDWERKHCVRVAFGNGLRPEVWPAFVQRFGIPQIAEVYASTEGNANLANTVGKEGAVGFISPLLARMYPVRLVRLADATGTGGGGTGGGGTGGGGNGGGGSACYGDLLRAPATGLCQLCRPGEVGELLGLVDQSDPSRNFAGYTDAEATRRRLVRDVLAKGDCWFRTGDLMRCDAAGFVYFADRMGDTFRYKGENVSTAEVAAAIGSLGTSGAGSLRPARGLQLRHCLVYGIQLPGLDGKVGMAALLPEANGTALDMRLLYEGLDAQLPGHAQPRFLRVLESDEAIETTHTFKPRTEVLQAKSVHPSDIGQVYVRDSEKRTFVYLEDDRYRRILEAPHRELD